MHDLTDAFPELRSVVSNHLYENFGEVLPRRLLGDVLEFALAAQNGNRPPGTEECVQPMLDFLEERFRSGDDAVRELIFGSFVQPLAHHGEAGQGVRSLLGPTLEEAAARAEPSAD